MLGGDLFCYCFSLFVESWILVLQFCVVAERTQENNLLQLCLFWTIRKLKPALSWVEFEPFDWVELLISMQVKQQKRKEFVQLWQIILGMAYDTHNAHTKFVIALKNLLLEMLLQMTVEGCNCWWLRAGLGELFGAQRSFVEVKCCLDAT